MSENMRSIADKTFFWLGYQYLQNWIYRKVWIGQNVVSLELTLNFFVFIEVYAHFMFFIIPH